MEVISYLVELKKKQTVNPLDIVVYVIRDYNLLDSYSLRSLERVIAKTEGRNSSDLF